LTKSSTPSRNIESPFCAYWKMRQRTSFICTASTSRVAFIAALPTTGGLPTWVCQAMSSVTRASTAAASLRRQSVIRPFTCSKWLDMAELLRAAAVTVAGVMAPAAAAATDRVAVDCRK
jgi:hypothetical protein